MYIYYLSSENTFSSFKLFVMNSLILQTCSVFWLRNKHICIILSRFTCKLTFLIYLQIKKKQYGEGLLNPRSSCSLLNKKSHSPGLGNRLRAIDPSIRFIDSTRRVGFSQKWRVPIHGAPSRNSINGLPQQTASLRNIWPRTNEISLPKLVAPVFTLTQPVLLAV
jgi:hypothetical protein